MSVLLSDKLLNVFPIILVWINDLLQIFTMGLSDLLKFSGDIESIFVTIGSIGIWWFITNGFIGLIYLLVRAMSSLYLSYYQPAYFLHQATIVVHEHFLIEQDEDDN